MNVYPGAVWLDAGYKGLHARQPRGAALLHTNGGGARLLGWWKQKATAGSSIGAQYQVFYDGTAECYADPALVVYHAYSASEFAIGIETQDDGKPETPWTPAQIAAIAAICVHHGVPAVMLSGSGPGDGVGFHQQQAAWNVSSHNCPGPVRRAQIPDVLAAMTALTTPQEDDMSPEQAQQLTHIENMAGGLAWLFYGPDAAQGEMVKRIRDLSGMAGALVARDPAAFAAQVPADLAQQVADALLARIAAAATP